MFSDNRADDIPDDDFINNNTFFQMLVAASKTNNRLSSPAHRFSGDLKKLCLYIFLTSGRLANIDNALPSLPTLYRTLSDCEVYTEGKLAFGELKQFLIKRGYPLKIVISEDQTAIVRRPRYDSRTNHLVGFVNTLSKTSGFPLIGENEINCLSDITKKIKTGLCFYGAGLGR